MVDLQEIHSLTDFLRNHKAHVKRLKKTRKPEILTVNGRAEVVVIDVESFQVILDKLAHVETVEAIKAGYEAAKRGEVRSLEEFDAEMRAKYDL
jgi:PHD/YefM family antitoxin component YafN of YafNO toxin-antitoxin module